MIIETKDDCYSHSLDELYKVYNETACGTYTRSSNKTITTNLMSFIENCIDIIDKSDWVRLKLLAYISLSRTEVETMWKMFRECGINYWEIQL